MKIFGSSIRQSPARLITKASLPRSVKNYLAKKVTVEYDVLNPTLIHLQLWAHILSVVPYGIATGTLSLMGETAAMVVAGILRQLPDSSRLPVGLRLIVLNQKAYRILPFGPGIPGLFTTVC